MSMHKPNDPIGNRTRDLPVCIAPLLFNVGSLKGGHVAVWRVDIIDITHWSMRDRVWDIFPPSVFQLNHIHTYFASCRWRSKWISTRNSRLLFCTINRLTGRYTCLVLLLMTCSGQASGRCDLQYCLIMCFHWWDDWKCFSTAFGCLNAGQLLFCPVFCAVQLFVRGATFGWGTALQVGRSRVRFPIVSLEFCIDIILPAALWQWGRLWL